MTESGDKRGAERDKAPGELRSWELREEPTVASERKWARLGKTLVYAVWITLLVIAIVAIVLNQLNPQH